MQDNGIQSEEKFKEEINARANLAELYKVNIAKIARLLLSVVIFFLVLRDQCLQYI